GLRELPEARLLAPVEANEIFLELPGTAMDALEADGFQFYRRSKTLARFVCRFDTTEAEADALVAAVRRHLAGMTARRAAEERFNGRPAPTRAAWRGSRPRRSPLSPITPGSARRSPRRYWGRAPQCGAATSRRRAPHRRRGGSGKA